MATAKRNIARSRRGFTLIELLVVIGLVGVVATIVISVGSAIRTKAATDEVRARLNVLRGAVEIYHEAMGEYPAHVIDWRDTRYNKKHKTYREAEDPKGQLRSARCNSAALLRQLKQVAPAKQALDPLSVEVYTEAKFDLLPDSVWGSTLVMYHDDPTGADDYAFIMDEFDAPANDEDLPLAVNYQKNGGAGGSPVLISAGPNGKFGDSDDIRSDDY